MSYMDGKSCVHLNKILKTLFSQPFYLWSDRGFVQQKLRKAQQQVLNQLHCIRSKMQLMNLTKEDYADRIISNNNAAPAANYRYTHAIHASANPL